MSTKKPTWESRFNCLHSQEAGVRFSIVRLRIMDIIHYVHLPARQHRSYSFLAIRLMRVAARNQSCPSGTACTYPGFMTGPVLQIRNTARSNGDRGSIDSFGLPSVGLVDKFGFTSGKFDSFSSRHDEKARNQPEPSRSQVNSMSDLRPIGEDSIRGCFLKNGFYLVSNKTGRQPKLFRIVTLSSTTEQELQIRPEKVLLNYVKNELAIFYRKRQKRTN